MPNVFLGLCSKEDDLWIITPSLASIKMERIKKGNKLQGKVQIKRQWK